MREKYLKICSFAKSRNMQIVLFVLVSFTATFYAFMVIFSAYFLGYIFFSVFNSIIQKFSIIFFLQNYPLLLERYLSFFGVSILCVLYPVFRICNAISNFMFINKKYITYITIKKILI